MATKGNAARRKSGWLVHLEEILGEKDYIAAYTMETALTAGNIQGVEACDVYGGKCECPRTRMHMMEGTLIPKVCSGGCPPRDWVNVQVNSKEAV